MSKLSKMEMVGILALFRNLYHVTDSEIEKEFVELIKEKDYSAADILELMMDFEAK